MRRSRSALEAAPLGPVRSAAQISVQTGRDAARGRHWMEWAVRVPAMETKASRPCRLGDGYLLSARPMHHAILISISNRGLICHARHEP